MSNPALSPVAPVSFAEGQPPRIPAVFESRGVSPERVEVEVPFHVLAGCRRGDREAQRKLYEQFSERVYRLSVRLVGRQDAPDLTQIVFLQLFRKIDRYAGRSKFGTWLYRLAVNEGLQYLRRQHRWWRVRPLVVEPESRNSGESACHGDIRESLEQALAKLPRDLRLILELREVEGLSYRDIGQILEVTEGTVGSRLNRARRKLRKHLEKLDQRVKEPYQSGIKTYEGDGL